MERVAPLVLVLAGHVDHGKSSLLGRLLHELDLLPAGKAEELAAMSTSRGVPLEWSVVVDGFQAERDEALTLDTTRVRLKTPNREFVVIDAPGHAELLKKMIGDASAATAALLVLDVQAGSEEQTRRHAYLLKLLGIRALLVAINKMDLADYAESRFRSARGGGYCCSGENRHRAHRHRPGVGKGRRQSARTRRDARLVQGPVAGGRARSAACRHA